MSFDWHTTPYAQWKNSLDNTKAREPTVAINDDYVDENNNEADSLLESEWNVF